MVTVAKLLPKHMYNSTSSSEVSPRTIGLSFALLNNVGLC